MPTISFRGGPAELRALLRRLPAILSGAAPDPSGIVRGLQLRLGVALLSKIQQAFIVKSRGGTGEDGIKWKPLDPRTIARRRITKAEAKAAKWKKGQRGAQSRLALFGGRQVDILRDTGELFRSLSPGVEDRPSGADGQVFNVGPGRVIVGTNKKPWHHHGVPGRLPARPLWPEQLPPAWAAALAQTLARGLARAVALLVTQGGKP